VARFFFSVRETEAILSISHAQVYRLIASGKLDARKLGNKTLITGESIEKLATQLPKLRRPGAASSDAEIAISARASSTEF
jgi:excisionase family DNA binding protein